MPFRLLAAKDFYIIWLSIPLTWWRLFHKRVVYTTLDINVFVIISVDAFRGRLLVHKDSILPVIHVDLVYYMYLHLKLATSITCTFSQLG
jgi:hypothetical protein